jgi:hypothetical protein
MASDGGWGDGSHIQLTFSVDNASEIQQICKIEVLNHLCRSLNLGAAAPRTFCVEQRLIGA